MSEQIKPWQIQENRWTQFKENKQLMINQNIMLTKPTLNQVSDIAKLLKGEEALVEVNEMDIVNSINKSLCLVACDTQNNKIIGYQALGLWEEMNLIELRSAKVLDEYRGQGINTVMKKLAIKIAETDYPDWRIVAFTEVASKSRGILAKLGFEEISLDLIKKKYRGLSSICPAQCYIKGGHQCGCKVFFLNNHEK